MLNQREELEGKSSFINVKMFALFASKIVRYYF